MKNILLILVSILLLSCSSDDEKEKSIDYDMWVSIDKKSVIKKYHTGGKMDIKNEYVNASGNYIFVEVDENTLVLTSSLSTNGKELCRLGSYYDPNRMNITETYPLINKTIEREYVFQE